jgi:copper chaperone CopZ
MARIALSITGMTCGHCRQKAEDALTAVDGVWAASVDLESGSAEVDYDDKRSDAAALIAAVEAAGYTATTAA